MADARHFDIIMYLVLSSIKWAGKFLIVNIVIEL